MITRAVAFLARIALLLLLFAGVARAADTAPATAPSGPIDQQYAAIATAHTKAELALRQDKLLFDKGMVQWLAVSATIDQIHTKIDQALDKAAAVEQRKDDAVRDQNALDELHERRAVADDDWLRFAGNERARMDREFHRGAEMNALLVTTLPNLIALEHAYKDMDMDLDAIRAAYDAFAAKADEAHDMSQKALNDLLDARKLWQTKLDATTQFIQDSAKAKAKDKGTP